MQRRTLESFQVTHAGASPLQATDTQELRSPHPLRPEEGFLLDRPSALYTEIAPDTLAPEALSPIRNLVPGLGKVALLERQEHKGHRHDDPERPDRWFSIELDGYEQAVRMTQADPSKSNGLKFVNFPGLTEKIEEGPCKVRHSALARIFPEAEMISIATDGVGDVGGKLALDQIWDHDLKTMAQQRLKLIRAICGDNPVILVGTSMGSVIANQLLDLDLQNGQDLLASPLYFESAIIPPERVKRDMLLLFGPAMLFDTSREILQMVIREGWSSLEPVKDHPRRLIHNALPIARQIIDLLQGVPMSRIERVTEHYQSGVISGRLDPLAETSMWGGLHNLHPDLYTKFIPLRGHGMAANGEAAARKIAASLRVTHVIDNLLKAA